MQDFAPGSAARRLGTALTLAALSLAAAEAQQATPKSPSLAENYGKLPLSFEANQGQTDPQVKFLSKGNGYTLFLTDKAAVLALTKTEKGLSDDQNKSGCPILTDHTATGKPCESKVGKGGIAPNSKTSTNKTDIVTMELTGANQFTKVEGNQQLPGIANYFLGNDPSKWHTNVPTYSKVSYKNVYPGVDLLYYGNQRQLEYDFVVQPKANPKEIKLHFAGAKQLTLNQNGDLEVVAANGEVAFHKPLLYQIKQGQRQPVEGTYTLLARNEVGFQVDAYDQSRNLIIDPTLEYSTYLGGSDNDYATAITADAAGNSYITGVSVSTNFPVTKGAFQTANAENDSSKSNAFVTKLNAEGSALVYSTYLGGAADTCSSNFNTLTQGDYGSAIAVDSAGNAYITGSACAASFPVTKGAFQTTFSTDEASNAFVTKLNPTGTALVYSTFLGGSGDYYSGDFGNGIAIDSAGDAYITGQTSSTNFPVTKGAYQITNPNANGTNSAFVSKLNPAGTALLYSTYLGGSGPADRGEPGDSGSAIAINGAGNAYVTGYAYSNNFPTTKGAYQTINKAHAISGSSPFVTELNTTGTALVFSTFVGGSTQAGNLQDSGNGIALDASGNVYIAGGTASTDFPTTKGAFQTKDGSSGVWANGFITKLNPSGTALVYSTYLGGSGSAAAQAGERVQAIAIDALGNAFLTGYSGSPNFPVTSGAYQTTNKSANKSETAFLTELNSTGTALVYSTYFGGSGSSANVNGDVGNAIAYFEGNVYFAGATVSTDFPATTDAYQKKNEAATGNSNAFIAKFAFATATTTTLTSDGNPEPVGAKVTFTADVTGTEGSGTPTGTVSFAIDGGTPVKVTLDDTGHASYSTTTLTAGVHKVVATYSGDPTHLASTSATLSQTIYGAAATITEVSGTSQSSTYGTAFAKPLVVIVKDSAGDVVPGATVTFSGAGLKFSATTATTAANGEASVTATPTALGTLTASATAAGVKTAATFTLTATKATLTVTATSITVAYDTAIPTLTYTITGYLNGDTSKVVTGAPTETTTAKDGSQPGTYPITLGLGTLAATNYSFTLVNGTVTIKANGTTATPTATQVITIADATSGYTVYYTTNGTTPTTSSTKYTGPITITATETLKFIAVAPGDSPSAVRTVTDTIQ